MIKTKDEILSAVRDLIGDSADDAALGVYEDIADTIEDLMKFRDDELLLRLEAAEKQVKETEEYWRNRYRDRFFGKDVEVKEVTEDETVDDTNDDLEVEEAESIEDLFKEDED